MARRRQNVSQEAPERVPAHAAHAAPTTAAPATAAHAAPASVLVAPAARTLTTKDRVLRAVPYAGLVVGLVVIAYFPASEAWDAYRRSQIAIQIDQAVESADSETIAELLAQAVAYNQQLAGEETDIAAEDIWDYEDQLSLTGHDTAFAYLIIPSISLTMPIYHGTTDAVLSAGAGHLETSSLPVGGESTHTVITAHSGLSGMRAFDDIDQLEVGDVFGIKVLGTLICYEVTSIEVVLPDEVDSLAIVEGEDLCTLVTCTPYGVNSHRLLVHATRCEVPDDFEGTATSAIESVVASQRTWPFLVAAVVVVAVLVGLAVWQAHARRARVARSAQPSAGKHARRGE